MPLLLGLFYTLYLKNGLIVESRGNPGLCFSHQQKDVQVLLADPFGRFPLRLLKLDGAERMIALGLFGQGDELVSGVGVARRTDDQSFPSICVSVLETEEWRILNSVSIPRW